PTVSCRANGSAPGSRANRKVADSSPGSDFHLTILDLAVGASGPTTGPSFSILQLEQPHSIRRLLVSGFLADSIQHIHSLRASGVISCHAVIACWSDASALFRSAGIL